MSDKSSIRTELELLCSLERGEVVTQVALSRRLSVSVGLINALLRRAIRKGLVKAKAAPYKRWAYYLTPAGFSEKSWLVAEYLEISLDFFRTARQEYVSLLERARALGAKEVVLLGDGELAEIALLAARELDLEVVGIFSPETNADRLYGLPVLRDLDGLGPTVALAMTASRRPQETFDRIGMQSARQRILTPDFLRVVQQNSGQSPKRDPARRD